jgi:NodT family efflux transporter outer membrane factor (OMF) lipoprotein
MTTRGIYTSSLAVILCASLSSCMAGKDYKKPELAIKPEWNIQEAKNVSVAENANPLWWKSFSDETLVGLIEKAVADNNDLKIIKSRLAEAMANERLANSTLFPQINAAVESTRAKAPNFVGLSNYSTISQGGISGNWDIDLFGSNRRRKEAAGAEVQAVEADSNQTKLAVITEVASNYSKLRAFQQQYDITAKNLNMQRETLEITKGQRKEGAISDLDVTRAQAQVDETDARLPQIKAAINSALNRISILTGEQPGNLNSLLDGAKAIPTIPPQLVITSPVKAISNRPDVKAAERRLAEATALSAAAIADFYPKLSLQGFFGLQDSTIYGNSSPLNVTASALLPLLNFGKLTSQSKAADARKEQALLNYKQTVLLAMEEVESRLSNYLNELNRHASLLSVAEHQAKAVEIAREQYKAGISAQIDLLVAERSLLDAGNDIVLSEQASAEDLIQLYRALGEGWSQEPEANTSTPPKQEAVPEDKPTENTPHVKKDAAPEAKPEAQLNQTAPETMDSTKISFTAI